MSTASEHRAWRGNRPASISRAPIAQPPRSSVVSPPPASIPTPGPALTEADGSRPSATSKLIEQTSSPQKKTSAPTSTGNVWDQRKAAAQQRDAKPPVVPGKKLENAASGSTYTTVDDEVHSPVNGFNSAQVQSLLAGDLSSLQTYQIRDTNSTKQQAGVNSTMANGQSFFAQLSKQVAQLQASK